MRRVRVRRVLAGAAVVAGLAVVVWALWPDPVPPWPPGAVVPVEQVAAFYRDHEAAADRQLRGHPIRVAVTPLTIYRGDYPPGQHPPYEDPPTAVFRAEMWPLPTNPHDGRPLLPGDVEFRFPSHEAAAGLKTGQPAVIEGVCDGVWRSSPGRLLKGGTPSVFDRVREGLRRAQREDYTEFRILVFRDCRVVGGP
jgi:hypothetical protein